jgi:hypothetical protein
MSRLTASDERRWEKRRNKSFERDYGPIDRVTPDVWKFPEPPANSVEPQDTPPKLWIAPTVVIAVIAIVFLV